MSISYLNLAIPNAGELVEVAQGVFWLRMPLPFDLDHINLYLIKDGEDGFALVDTGIGTKQTETLWEQIISALDTPITKVIVTHMHPDHIGMAGYLVEKFRVPFYMSHDEYFVGRAISAGPRGASDWQDQEYLVRCGMSKKELTEAQKNRQRSKGIGSLVKPIPLQFTRLSAGDTLTIDNENWLVIIGKGHSPEHVSLYNANSNILISGDHVLPHISPNIGVYNTEPNANPLKQYLDTLPQFTELPSDALVLPSHKQPFYGLHTRVNELINHHHEHLDNLRVFCQQGKTIEQCLPVLFKRKLNSRNIYFAIAESFAHLNYLYFTGECSRHINAEGQFIFTLK
ncbi:MBL fold metallo-hydrolase [Paraglaciecola sp. 2405UD69-4]|uniref:MBL fold metallo-hydrolase n=1 Tax=Paraglaciecola sp. 2405UD69-4 TaxID=3391836 RepID=UPI0039C98A20